jgi:hypothetical protein
MNAEDMIDTTVAALKIISMVPKNGRLCIRKGQLTLDPPEDSVWHVHLRSLRRWVSHDSREISLMHIKNTIANAIKLSRGLVDGSVETKLRQWSLHTLTNEMCNAQVGIVNLKTTYSGDSLMIANLDVVSERLAAHCEAFALQASLLVRGATASTGPHLAPSQPDAK